ncbi:MAG: hypothetical protein OQK49_06885 [Proteobacteria bacterium]|nr:hypothetical protein [Pseudomonadota bacterium]
MNNTTENMKNKSHEIYEKLKTERDQLKLKRHLMNEELEEKWQSSEKQWSRLKSKFSTITKGAGEAVDDLSLGFSVLGDEIKEAYKDIKLGIKSSKLTK